MRYNSKSNAEAYFGLAILVTVLAGIAAWITSIINCLSYGKWLLLIVDIICGPVGVVHGVGLWFGANW